MGDGVAWQFKAGGPTDLNIHYHSGKEVTYPENREHIASADATRCPSLDQHYRWKWSNASVHGVDIEVPLEQVGEAN